MLEFLDSFESEMLVLAGDIIDIESMRQEYYWPDEHHEVLRALLAKARSGTRVIFVPGNHDAELRAFCDSTVGSLEIRREFVHTTADGRRMLITHGDECDTKVGCAPWLARLGDVLYDFILALNRHGNSLRRRLGLPYFSVAGRLKRMFTRANQYIATYEKAVAQRARERGFDGAICGHIHQSRIETIDGVLYCNSGDWVESCSALIEDAQGRLSIWQHAGERAPVARSRLAAAVPTS